MNKEMITNYLSEIKEFLIEVTSLSKGIFNLIWNNKAILSVFLVIYIFYEGIHYIAFEMPKRTVYTYYKSIDNRDFGKGWNMLTSQFQVRWKNGESDFVEGYKTLTSTNILNVSNLSDKNLFEEIVCDKKQLQVDLIIVENFSKNDVVDSTGKDKISQLDNLLWLTIKHKDGVGKMKDEKLSNFRSTLKLVRRYKKIFTIEKEARSDFIDMILSNNWVIADVDNKEISLINDTTYYDR